jgi:hypothetical protein
LEDAQRRSIVVLRRDQRSGSYIVEDLGTTGAVTGRLDTPVSGPTRVPDAATVVSANGAVTAPGTESTETTNGGRPRRRRGRGRGRGRGTTVPGGYPDTSSPSSEFDEHDEGDDDGPEGDDAAPDGPEASFRPDGADRDPAPVSSETPSPSADKPAFSLFSWIRRDQPASPDKPDPEENR